MEDTRPEAPPVKNRAADANSRPHGSGAPPVRPKHVRLTLKGKVGMPSSFRTASMPEVCWSRGEFHDLPRAKAEAILAHPGAALIFAVECPKGERAK